MPTGSLSLGWRRDHQSRGLRDVGGALARHVACKHATYKKTGLRLLVLLGTVVTALAQTAPKPEITPTDLPGAETFLYREAGTPPMRLFVVKPAGWKAGDRRPALMFFFGGGWTTGTPASSIFWARFFSQTSESFGLSLSSS